jgi:hypothetical protein
MTRTFLLLLLTMASPLVLAAQPRIAHEDLQKLLDLPDRATVSLAGIPLNETRLGNVTLRRIDVFAPGARVLIATQRGLVEAPRSTWRHFVADKSAPGAPRLALSIDPDTREARGALFDVVSEFDIRGTVDDQGDLTLALTPVLDLIPAGASADTQCSLDRDPARVARAFPNGAQIQATTTTTIAGTTRNAVIAIDTDNELMLEMFNNNTTSATNYIAQLFAAMNVMYERDLNLTLLIGTTILRPSTSNDPYGQGPSGNGAATPAQLDEFGNFWATNQTATPRVLAAMLSGKSPDPLGGSGIANILSSGIYCNQTAGTSGGYSFSQLLTNQAIGISFNASLVGHELGHNFGVHHTHCTNSAGQFPAATNTLDQCFSGESGQGCYGGTTSCPGGANGTPGSIMSYCHLRANGQGQQLCGNSLLEFHPVHETSLLARIGANVPSCITQGANQAPTITAPGSISVAEDTPSSLAGISFGDVDAGAGNLLATFTVPVGQGSLSASSGGGVTVGGTTTARTLTGTLSALNNFVAAGSLTYTSAQDASGSVTLGVQINDNGNTGSGGALSASTNVSLQITATNDPPTVTVPVSISVTEDTASNVAGISFADVDAPGTANVIATFSVPSGQGTLTGQAMAGITVQNPSANVLTVAGQLNTVNVYVANNNVRFTTAPNATSNVTLTAAINDGGATGAGGAQTGSANITLSVIAVNDTPVVTAPATIDVSVVAISNLLGISFADVDAGSATVTASFSIPAGQGTLSATAGGGVTGGGSGSAISLQGTIANINAFIAAGNLRYTPQAGNPATVVLSISLNDGGATGSGGPRTGNGSTTLQLTNLFANGFE